MSYQVICATLTARTALHIGSGEGNDLTDALIRRTATGEPVIPGTALAGALRSMITRLAPRLGGQVCQALTIQTKEELKKPCNCAVCRLFGDIQPTDEADSPAEASHVLIFDARPILIPAASSIRDGVGIDRASGAAARAGAVKFDLETLPAGSMFELRIELRKTTTKDEELLAVGLAEWQAGRMWLGGRVGRGLGAFELGELQLVDRDLATPTKLVAFLRDDRPWQKADVKADWLSGQMTIARGHVKPVSELKDLPEVVARRWVQAEFILQAEGPLLTNETLASVVSGFDHAPLLAEVGKWDKPILTGAGLRGVLRSHAERIARTLVTLDVTDEQQYLTRCPACDPNVSRTDRSADPLALESCDSRLKWDMKRGGDEEVALVEMCLACRLFGSTRWGSRLIVEDAPFIGGQPEYKMLDFLAIDRFTGGSSEGLKFDALVLWRPRFKVRMFLDNPQEWELGWLALVLRDLHEQWLNVGFGAAKGFGRVSVPEWSVRAGYVADSDFPLHVKPVTETETVYQIVEVKHDVAETQAVWLAELKKWTSSFKTEWQRENKALVPLKRDSYFEPEGRLKNLYPKEVALR